MEWYIKNVLKHCRKLLMMLNRFIKDCTTDFTSQLYSDDVDTHIESYRQLSITNYNELKKVFRLCCLVCLNYLFYSLFRFLRKVIRKPTFKFPF